MTRNVQPQPLLLHRESKSLYLHQILRNFKNSLMDTLGLSFKQSDQ